MKRKKTSKGKRRTRREEDMFSSGLAIPEIEIPSLDFPLSSEHKKIDPNKMSKVKLVGILSNHLSTNQIYKVLIRLGKHKLADDFINEVEFVNKKYDKMLRL